MPIKKSELYSSIWKSCDELRGGMDASQYKDYVLVLLFVKYVSDKYAGQKNALLDVPKGGRFADMVALKGDKEIGEKMNKIISKLAEPSEKVSAFDDLSLIQLIVERGVEALNALPDGIRKNQDAVAETIENNVRRLIIDESPINPKYYERMSLLLDALIAQRKQEALDYAAYLAKVVELTRQAKSGPAAAAYPSALDTPARRALYDNLEKNEALALAVDAAVRENRQDDWRNNPFKVKRVRNAIREALLSGSARASKPTTAVTAKVTRERHTVFLTDAEETKLKELVDRILSLVQNQHEY